MADPLPGRLVRDQEEKLDPATLDRSGLLRGALVGATGLLLGGALTSYGQVSPASMRGGSEGAQGGAAAKRKVLIAYFSRPGENYYYGGRRDIKVGNTEVLATMLAKHIGADVYRIRAASPYPHDYEATVARNVREQNADARPRIANPLKSIDNYDVVLLGSPIWNLRPPMIMSTFTESFDFSGKTIHPFVTYAVSQLGTTMATYADVSTGARITTGLAVRGETVRERRAAGEGLAASHQPPPLAQPTKPNPARPRRPPVDRRAVHAVEPRAARGLTPSLTARGIRVS